MLSRSRMSPRTISICMLSGEPSSQPHDPVELYSTNARVRAPISTSLSVRWLPMNPPAPVTRTVFLPQSKNAFPVFLMILKASRGYIGFGPIVVVRLSYVEPVFPDGKTNDRPALFRQPLD